MPELTEVETPKTAGFVDRGYNYEKKQRMEDEEEEIRLEQKLNNVEEESEPTKNRTQKFKETSKQEKADTEALKKKRYLLKKNLLKNVMVILRRHMQDKEKEWDEKFQSFEERLK